MDQFKRFFFTTLGLCLLVYLSGAFLVLMDPDATSYAAVTMEMYLTGEFWKTSLNGQDWLDKPHFQFWVTLPFYYIFGLSSFAYRLPSILVFLFGVYYTYRYGKRFYNEKVGLTAAIVLMTALHILISNSDVRAEQILAGLSIFCLYHWAVFLDTRKRVDFVLACLGLALLLMTKGLYTIIPIAGGVGLGLLYRQKYFQILHPQWLLAFVLTFVFVGPSLIAYYIQFDMHPEKEIFGKKGVSGVRFFLWDSQWGRFTNTGPIKGQGDKTFFLHTVLWAFAPWAILAYYAVIQRIGNLFSQKDDSENYSLFAFLTLFTIFSLSSFQLPHYLNIIFPFLSLLVADRLWKIKSNFWKRFFLGIQGLHILLFLAAIPFLHYMFRSDHWNWDFYLAAGILMVGIAYFLFREKIFQVKILFSSAFLMLLMTYFLNREFYPYLLKYQSESEVVFYLKEKKLEGEFGTLGILNRAVDFYSGAIIPEWGIEELRKSISAGRLLYTTEKGKEDLEKAEISFEILKEFEDYTITLLRPKFLNKDTRSEAISRTYLLKIR